MAATVLFLLPALVLSATIAEARFVVCAPHSFNALHSQAITDFTLAVNRYAEIHRLLSNPMSATPNAGAQELFAFVTSAGTDRFHASSSTMLRLS